MTLEHSSCDFDIPYCLKSVEDIEKAIRQDLLGLSEDYRKALEIAPRLTLNFPHAFMKARKAVTKAFYAVRKEKIIHPDVAYLCVNGLRSIDNINDIEQSLPGLQKIARLESPYDLIYEFMEKSKKRKKYSFQDKGIFEQVMEAKKFVQQELLTYASAKASTSLNKVELIQAITAQALFDPNNQDVLEALRLTGGSDVSQDSTYQNACAELLFGRIPSVVGNFLFPDPKPIRKKLFSKLEKLGIDPLARAGLYGYFPSALPKDQIYTVIDKIASISQKLPNITDDNKVKVRHYIMSLKQNIGAVEKIYEDLFLSKDLACMKKLYVPQRIMIAKVSYKDVILKKYTITRLMTLYPTKDYMDLFKGRISDDCTKINLDLSEAQLRTPHFINIRIFNQDRWAGNIYMLDLTKDYKLLLIDRIQIPREANAFFVDLFDILKEALAEIFEEVNYEKLLIPSAVSNHAKVQEIFNAYKQRLKRITLNINEPYAKHFESLTKNQQYYVLFDK